MQKKFWSSPNFRPAENVFGPIEGWGKSLGSRSRTQWMNLKRLFFLQIFFQLSEPYSFYCNIWFIKIRTIHKLSLWLYYDFFGKSSFLMPWPLKWSILGAHTIILSKNIHKVTKQIMSGSNFYESDVTRLIYAWVTQFLQNIFNWYVGFGVGVGRHF